MIDQNVTKGFPIQLSSSKDALDCLAIFVSYNLKTNCELEDDSSKLCSDLMLTYEHVWTLFNRKKNFA